MNEEDSKKLKYNEKQSFVNIPKLKPSSSLIGDNLEEEIPQQNNKRKIRRTIKLQN